MLQKRSRRLFFFKPVLCLLGLGEAPELLLEANAKLLLSLCSDLCSKDHVEALHVVIEGSDDGLELSLDGSGTTLTAPCQKEGLGSDGVCVLNRLPHVHKVDACLRQDVKQFFANALIDGALPAVVLFREGQTVGFGRVGQHNPVHLAVNHRLQGVMNIITNHNRSHLLHKKTKTKKSITHRKNTQQKKSNNNRKKKKYDICRI